MTDQVFKGLIRGAALVAFLAGGLGCVLCVPYASSTSLYWIAVAGVYFVAGGIMITGGLITLSLLSRTDTNPAQ